MRRLSFRTPRSILTEKVIAFFLGLSVTTGVIYVFTVGNTPVYIGYCVAVFAFAILLLVHPRRLYDAVTAIDKSILSLFGIAALSIIPALFYATIGDLGIEAPIMVIKGLVVLAAGIAVYIVTIALHDSRIAMVRGVAVGVAINVIFSVLANIAFNAGSVFSLFSLFPQDAFVIPMQWGVSGLTGGHAIYTFRAQGLFLEASHLMVFLIAWGILCSVSVKHIFAKTFLLIGIVYVSAQSLSPNVAILSFEAVLCVFAYKSIRHSGAQQSIGSKSIPHATIVAALILLFFGVLAVLFFGGVISELFGKIFASLGDLNVMSSTDTGTAARFESMTSTLSLLPNYLFGAGWNTENLVLTAHFGSSTFASHSFALRLLLEIGPLGLIIYCWTVWRHTVGAYRASMSGRFVAVAIICMAIAQSINGTTLLPYVWLLLGLAKGIEQKQ